MHAAAGLEHNPAFTLPVRGLAGPGLPQRPSSRASSGNASDDTNNTGGGSGAAAAATAAGGDAKGKAPAGGSGAAAAEQAKRKAEAQAVRQRFVQALVDSTEGASWSVRLYLARVARAAGLDGGRLAALAPLVCPGLSGAVQDFIREAGDAAR